MVPSSDAPSRCAGRWGRGRSPRRGAAPPGGKVGAAALALGAPVTTVVPRAAALAGGVAEEASIAFAEVTVARRLPEAAARVAGDAAPPVCAPAERVRRAPALVGVAARVGDDARDVGAAELLVVGVAAGTSLDLPRRGPGPTAGAGAVAPPSS